MNTVLVEQSGNAERVYDTLMLEPRHLHILSSPLALRVVQTLAFAPSCPLDLARQFEEHEQKVYYACRKLESAGIIRKVAEEKRFGMTAKIYGLVSPTVATKLVDQQASRPSPVSAHHAAPFLGPFIQGSQFSGLVVFGDTTPHGRHGFAATHGHTVFDLGVLLGTFVRGVRQPYYKRDTQLTETDLRQHLIVIGHPRSNMLLDRLNSFLPVSFDEGNDFAIVSRATGRRYGDPHVGVFASLENPFAPDKRLLVFAGRTRGIRAACIAFAYRPDVFGGAAQDCLRIVQGVDRDGDGAVDDIVRLE